MTTERILDKIKYIETHSKNAMKTKEEMEIVESALEKIRLQDWDLFDSLNGKYSSACCN